MSRVMKVHGPCNRDYSGEDYSTGLGITTGGSSRPSTGGSSGGGAAQLAMVWLGTKLRIAQSFHHAFSFQIHSPPPPGAESVPTTLPEYGCRFALCFQQRWAPGDIQRWRQTAGAVSPGVLRETPLADSSGPSANLWSALGECLALEVEYCVLPHRPSATPLAEVTLSLYLCQPGLEGDAPSRASGGPGAVQLLATATLNTPSPRQMIHLVRLWYDASKHQLQVFFGADAVAPACAAEMDIGASMSLDLGCAYAGFCLVPLDYKHRLVSAKGARSAPAKDVYYSSRDRPVSIVSWRHNEPRSSKAAVEAISAGKPIDVEATDVEETVGSGAWFSCLGLSYRVPWPLPLVITQHCLERYNRLFRLLLAFRHAHLELQHVELPRKDLQSAWALRSQISYFVSQVLQYFQQDVIEAAHRKLLQSVESSKSFDDVTEAHEDSALEAIFGAENVLRHGEASLRLHIAPGPDDEGHEYAAADLEIELPEGYPASVGPKLSVAAPSGEDGLPEGALEALLLVAQAAANEAAGSVSLFAVGEAVRDWLRENVRLEPKPGKDEMEDDAEDFDVDSEDLDDEMIEALAELLEGDSGRLKELRLIKRLGPGPEQRTALRAQLRTLSPAEREALVGSDSEDSDEEEPSAITKKAPPAPAQKELDLEGGRSRRARARARARAKARNADR
ncbi:unnamed protein product [Polarella glacialis]|uniref:Spindle pole body component n=1 Tax=Polarella glacialis TaxID=89957 RepID=A0A813LKI7_POLGL|nr:unnamed protein product [Polarella glacialis]